MASSIGSSLDIPTLVNAMMKPHVARANTYSKKISDYNVKISDLSKLKTSFDELNKAIKNVEANQSSKLATADLKTALQTFVTDYNASSNLAKTSSEYTVRSSFNSVRRNLDATTAYNLGISFDKEGVASFDSSKIDKIIANEANGVFTTMEVGGVTTNVTLDTMINGFFDNVLSSTSAFSQSLDYNGLFDVKTSRLQSQVSGTQKKLDDLNKKMSDYELQYTKKFSTLQNTLDKLNSVQTSMTAYTNILTKKDN